MLFPKNAVCPNYSSLQSSPQTTDPYGVSLTLSFPKYLLQSSLQDVPEIQKIPKLTDAQIVDTAHTCGVSLCNLSMALIFFSFFLFVIEFHFVAQASLGDSLALAS